MTRSQCLSLTLINPPPPRGSPQAPPRQLQRVPVRGIVIIVRASFDSAQEDARSPRMTVSFSFSYPYSFSISCSCSEKTHPSYILPCQGRKAGAVPANELYHGKVLGNNLVTRSQCLSLTLINPPPRRGSPQALPRQLQRVPVRGIVIIVRASFDSAPLDLVRGKNE